MWERIDPSLRDGLNIVGGLVLLLALWRWVAAWRANGGFVWRTFATVLRLAARSVRGLYFIAGVVILVIWGVDAVGVFDIVPPVPLVLVIGFSVLGVTWLGLPPAVLLLGASVPAHLSFYQRVMVTSRPLRLVHLLDAPAMGAPPSHWLSGASLRVARGGSWFTAIDTLVDLVPIVVLDARVLTPAVGREVKRVLTSNELRRRTIVVGSMADVSGLVDLAQHPNATAPYWVMEPDTALGNLYNLCREVRERRGRPAPLPPSPPEADPAAAPREMRWSVRHSHVTCGAVGYVTDSDVVGPDTRHIACLVRTEQGTSVFSQSTTGPAYERVNALRLGSPPVVAYAAYTGGRWWVHFGDQAYGPFPDVGITSPVLSPDSRHVAFTALQSGGWFAFVDGAEIGGPYEGFGAGGIAFSPDSRRTIYVIKQRDRWRAVVDGVAQEAFVTIQRRSQGFSPDSAKAVCIAMVRGRFVGPAFVGEGGVVVDGEVSRTWAVDGRQDAKGLGNEVFFSPDSHRMAYWVRTGSKVRVVVDGEPQLRGDGISSGWLGPNRDRFPLSVNAGWSNGGITFSPDSRHIAYALRRKGLDRLVYDGTELAAHETILNRPIVFSPDSNRLAYGVSTDRGDAMVIDGVEGRPRSRLPAVSLAFSRDSKHSAYAIPGRTGDWLVMDDESVPLVRSVVEGSGLVWGDRSEVRVAVRQRGLPSEIVEIGPL